MVERRMSNFKAHGTPSAYNKGCRCDECKEANRLRCAKSAAKRRARSDVPHGTVTGYRNWACRCDLCKAASVPDSREKYLRSKVETGSAI